MISGTMTKLPNGDVLVGARATAAPDLGAILAKAKAAAQAEALRIWDRDEHQDRGSCGGAVLMLKGGTKLAKAAIAAGVAFKSGKDIFIGYGAWVPDTVQSQNADIQQEAARAFKRVLDEAGLGWTIKKFWTYID